jgi:iron complex outermembrane recepter protein
MLAGGAGTGRAQASDPRAGAAAGEASPDGGASGPVTGPARDDATGADAGVDSAAPPDERATADAGAPSSDGAVVPDGDVDGGPEPVAPEDAGEGGGEPSSTELGAVVVTGVRGGRPRTVADSPEPVDVIAPEEIQKSGHAGLKEVLSAIVPALTMPAQGGGGTSASVRPYAYRGLSGDYLLVLVNGKRRHTTSLINNLALVSGGSSPIDLDLIPATAVGRIEILRDGAAAQYGSDAISGVMNIILDSEPSGLSFTETGGSTYTQGAELLQETLGYGAALPNGGFIRFSAEGKLHNPSTSSAAAFPTTFNGKPNYYYPPIAPGVPDPREKDTYNYVPEGGYGRSNRDIIVSGAYNAELPVDRTLTLYSFSTLAYRDIKDARGNFAANNLNSLPQIYPNGFQAYRRIWEWDGQAALGARAKLAGWDWDLSSSYGRDNAKLGAENTLNPSLGPTSPTTFFLGRQIVDLWINNLDVTRPFEIGLAAPLQLSVGVEHRWEEFQNQAGEPNSYQNGGYIVPTGTAPFNLAFGGQAPSPGLASFSGTTPSDARELQRNNVAGYVDLFTNLTKDWYLGVAGRAEHYDDSAGNTVSGKVSTRYEILPGLAIRGGVNNGFRAPSLAQTGFSTTQFTGSNINGVVVTTVSKFLPVDSPAAIALGAQPLKPETSLNFSLGVTYEPVRAFRFTVDGYEVHLNDRIVKTDFIGTSNNGGGAVKTLLLANGIAGVDSAQYFTNAIDTTTWGTDIVAEYTLRSESLGTFHPTAAFSYASTHITHVIPNPPQLSSLNVVLFGRQGQIDLVRASPKDKLILTANWAIWRLKNTLRFTRYDEYTEASTTAGFDVTYGAKWITDVDVEYQISDHYSVGLGAYNVFNVYPDQKGPAAVTGAMQYGSFSPFGLTGGFYYARLGADF